MKKVIFGSALFIGGILLLFLLVFAEPPVPDLIIYFLYILDFALICAGFIIGLKGIKEK